MMVAKTGRVSADPCRVARFTITPFHPRLSFAVPASEVEKNMVYWERLMPAEREAGIGNVNSTLHRLCRTILDNPCCHGTTQKEIDAVAQKIGDAAVLWFSFCLLYMEGEEHMVAGDDWGKYQPFMHHLEQENPL